MDTVYCCALQCVAVCCSALGERVLSHIQAEVADTVAVAQKGEGELRVAPTAPKATAPKNGGSPVKKKGLDQYKANEAHSGVVCCGVLRCVPLCSVVLRCDALWCGVVCCGVVCCSVLQCVAVCCSVLNSRAEWSLIYAQIWRRFSTHSSHTVLPWAMTVSPRHAAPCTRP